MANWKLEEAPSWYAEQWLEERRAAQELADAIAADSPPDAGDPGIPPQDF